MKVIWGLPITREQLAGHRRIAVMSLVPHARLRPPDPSIDSVTAALRDVLREVSDRKSVERDGELSVRVYEVVPAAPH